MALRLRSIPPRTMGTVAAPRARPVAAGQVVHLRQNLLALQGRLRELAVSDGRNASRSTPSAGLRFGSLSPAAGPQPANLNGKHGRVYPKARRPRQAMELLIQPRPMSTSGRTRHSTSETAEVYVVGIEFPVVVCPEEIRWELCEDVLEVEYLGQAFTYCHAFLIPVDAEPTATWADRSLILRFPKSATEPQTDTSERG